MNTPLNEQVQSAFNWIKTLRAEIASVIVGGTALKGGEGKIFGTVVGAILLSVISNILNLTSIISVYLNAAVQGIVIIIVAFLQRSRR